jgi:hypothetical protein
MIYQVLLLSHLQEISWKALLGFRENQFLFLKGFQAQTEVPMEEYAFAFQLWTLYFRPFWADIGELWSVAAAFENTISLILSTAGIITMMVGRYKKPPHFLLAGLVLVFGMSLIFLLNLNNLGLMMRMKSSLMIFLHLSAVYWVLFNWKYYNCERIKS